MIPKLKYGVEDPYIDDHQQYSDERFNHGLQYETDSRGPLINQPVHGGLYSPLVSH
jgi:hypothetical protein